METEQVLALLAADNNAGYGSMPLASARDDEIAGVLEAVHDPASFQRMQGRLTQAHVATLTCFAERMATLAVRKRARRYLVLGFTAIALAGLVNRDREALLILPLQWDAARRIGYPPEEVLEEVARSISPSAARYLRGFAERSETDKSIETMGYRVESTGEEFRYVRDW